MNKRIGLNNGLQKQQKVNHKLFAEKRL